MKVLPSHALNTFTMLSDPSLANDVKYAQSRLSPGDNHYGRTQLPLKSGFVVYFKANWVHNTF